MKRIIVILAVVILGVGFFSSCATHSKCPAYGHYTQAVAEQEVTQLI